MGLIPSASTVYAVAYLTKMGRELLFSNNQRYQVIGSNTVDRFEITQFSIGDPDTNYSVAGNLSTGEVPDISGKRDACIKGAMKIDLETPLLLGTSGGVPAPSGNYTYTVGQRGELEINVNNINITNPSSLPLTTGGVSVQPATIATSR